MAIDQAEMVGVLLAYSDTWQELVSAADPDEAAKFIHKYQSDDAGEDAAEPYPKAIIQEIAKTKQLVGTATWRGSGTLLLSIKLEIPDEHAASVETQRVWFREQIDEIELNLRTTSAGRSTPTGYTHSHFQFRTLSWEIEPFLIPIAEREDEDEQSDVNRKPAWAMQFRLEY